MHLVLLFRKYWGIIIPSVLIITGLLLRDAFDYEINKYIFLALAAYPIICLKINKVLAFVSFLIPLYFGLPGNYISLLILVRFIVEGIKGNNRINSAGMTISIILSLYILSTVLFQDDYDVYNLMGTLDYINLFFFVSYLSYYRGIGGAIFGYAAGTTALGAIMLTTTLQHFTFLDLMGGTNRLGHYGGLDDIVESQMVTTIDPNFYGMFAIALISSAYLLLKNKYFTNKIILIVFMISSVIICLCGLSRAFLIILCLWVLLTIVSRGSVKGLFSNICIFLIIALSVLWIFPDVVDAFDERMHDSTMSGGNGRIELIIDHYSKWGDSLQTILFGLGLYENNVHCGPLRYLFGIGIVGFVLLTIWLLRIFSVVKRGCKHISFANYLPFILTVAVFSTIPAAGSINAIFPLIISALALRL